MADSKQTIKNTVGIIDLNQRVDQLEDTYANSFQVLLNPIYGTLGSILTRLAALEAGEVTPVNPSFTVQPSILSDGTPQVGEVLTGVSGTIINGSLSARAWLLNGTVISGATSSTYTPSTIGNYAYRETATGVVGTTPAVATSVAVTVAAATPTPTPSPTVLTQPTVSPASAPAGSTFTATPGTYSNSTGLSRVWLLNGSSISSLVTANPSTSGTLTYQETATGPGGSVQSNVVSVNVTASAPTGRNNGISMNLGDFGYASDTGYFINKITSAGAWGFQTGGNDKVQALDQFGNPTAPNSGNNFVATLVGLSTGRHVMAHNGGGNITLNSDSAVVTLVSGGGTQRAVYDVDATNGGQAKLIYNGTTGYPTGGSGYSGGTQTGIAIYLEADEAKYRSGQIFTDTFLSEAGRWNVLRFLNPLRTNSNTSSDGSNRPRSPMEWLLRGMSLPAAVALCNSTQTDMWYSIPAHYTDAAFTTDLTYIRDNLAQALKLHLEYTNEPWNFGFEQTNYLYNMGQSDATFLANYRAYKKDNSALGAERQAYGYKLVGLSLIAQTVFASQRNRLRIETNLQTVDPQYSNVCDGIRSLGYEPNEIMTNVALSCYLTGGINSGTNRVQLRTDANAYNNGNSTQKAAIITKLIEQIRNGGQTGYSDNGITLASWKNDISTVKAALVADGAGSAGIGLSIYEADVVGHFNFDFDVGGISQDTDYTLVSPLINALINSTQAAAIISDAFTHARQSGIYPICVYQDYGAPSKYGPWGSKLRVGAAETGRSQAQWDFQTGATVALPAVQAFALATNSFTTTIARNTYKALNPAPSGGKAPYKGVQKSGALPTGMDIKGYREVGTPTTNGNTAGVMSVLDSNGSSLDVANNLTVADPVAKRGFYVITQPGGSYGAGDQRKIAALEFFDSSMNPISTSGVTPFQFKNNGGANEQADKLFDNDFSTAIYPDGGSPRSQFGCTFPAGISPAYMRVRDGFNGTERFIIKACDASDLVNNTQATAGTVIGDYSGRDVGPNEIVPVTL